MANYKTTQQRIEAQKQQYYYNMPMPPFKLTEIAMLCRIIATNYSKISSVFGKF